MFAVDYFKVHTQLQVKISTNSFKHLPEVCTNSGANVLKRDDDLHSSGFAKKTKGFLVVVLTSLGKTIHFKEKT